MSMNRGTWVTGEWHLIQGQDTPVYSHVLPPASGNMAARTAVFAGC
jgi:hypothetical protein